MFFTPMNKNEEIIYFLISKAEMFLVEHQKEKKFNLIENKTFYGLDPMSIAKSFFKRQYDEKVYKFINKLIEIRNEFSHCKFRDYSDEELCDFSHYFYETRKHLKKIDKYRDTVLDEETLNLLKFLSSKSIK
jgi:hypothetical protein